MNVSKLAKSALFGSALLGIASIPSMAAPDTTDILIQVLVRKGVLSASEAESIRQEVNVVAAAQQAEIVDTVSAKVSAQSAQSAGYAKLPSKLSAIRPYANARFRYNYENADGVNNDRSKWRYRIRIGADYDFKDSPFSLGAQAETASSNDSNNADFGGFFDKSGGEIYLGQLYLRYQTDALTVTFGKQEGVFELPRMLWDGDLNPEGLTESFKVGGWTVHAGQYLIDGENETKQTATGPRVGDDMLLMAQGINTFGGVTVAPFVMMTTSGQSTAPDNGAFSGGNATPYFHDFFVIGLPFEYGFNIGDRKSKAYGVWGMNTEGDDLVNTPHSPFYAGPLNNSSKNQFAVLGLQYGLAKKSGQSQFSAEYRYMEAGAYSPNLSDSDWAKGLVNQQGFVFNHKYMFTDFFGLSTTYLLGGAIDDDYLAKPGKASDTEVLLIDAEIKF